MFTFFQFPRHRGLLAALFLFTACSGVEPEPEPALADLGADPSLPAAQGEARAGVIRDGEAGEAALFGGIAAEGRVGDIKIYNSEVQFILQGAYIGHGYVQGGGNIIDVDLVRADGQLGRDSVDDIFLSFGVGRLFEATELSIVQDGSDGGPAIVRARGTDVPWDFIQGATEAPEPLLGPQNLDIVTDYELAPDSYSLKVSTTFTNVGEQVSRFNPSDGYMGSEEDFFSWTADYGLQLPEGGDLLALGAAGKRGEGLLSLWTESGTMSPLGIASLVSSAGLSVVSHGWTDLPPGESLELVRHWTFAPDAVSAELDRRRSLGEDLARVSGRVTDSESGAGLAGVRVHFAEQGADASRTVGWATSDAEGRYSAEIPLGDWLAVAVGEGPQELVDLPPGAGRYAPFAAASVNARQLAVIRGDRAASAPPWATGHPLGEPSPFSLAAGGDVNVDLELDPSAVLVVELRDDQGAPIPGVIEVRLSDGATTAAPPLPQSLWAGLGLRAPSNRVARAWTASGRIELALPPGSYDVEATHSFRYERDSASSVALSAGEGTTVQLHLSEVLARGGWYAMDSHLHAAPSSDGSLAMEDRLIACAATGVEIPVTTDHDRMSNYQPLASALGLGSDMHVVPGLEVSPVIRGHFNLFPLQERPRSVENGGALAWWDVPEDTQELMDRMRDLATEDGFIQVNHGRDGMMSFASYAPGIAAPNNPDFWSWDFDGMEVINSSGWQNWSALRLDWYSMLSTGRLKLPTGVSDSHSRSAACGYARTDVFVDVDRVEDLSDEAIMAALRAGHVVVAIGVTLRATLDAGAGAVLPGDVTEGTAGTLSVQVSGPSWIRPQQLRVLRNGEIVYSELLGGATDGFYFDGTIPVEATEDSWFVVEVEDGDAFGGVLGGARPYAFTNAFFLDVDGGGWEPPGLD